MANFGIIFKLLVIFLLIVLSLVIYVYIARRRKISTLIIRNKNRTVALVGAGFIFPMSYLLSSFFFDYIELYFLVGLSIISIISFIDDVKPIKSKFRFIVQVIVGILIFYSFYQAQLFSSTSILALLVLVILLVGYINASNFMDGINGMLGLKMVLTIGSFAFINNYDPFTNQYILYGLVFSGVLFLIGNFRSRPLFISGDVGSISLGVIVGYLILRFYLIHSNPVIFLLMLIYLIDTGATLIFNLIVGTPIFKQHRNHLYEKLVYTNNIDDRKVSAVYGGIQLTICLLVIYCIVNGISNWSIVIISAGCLIIIYTIFRYYNYINETRSKTTN